MTIYVKHATTGETIPFPDNASQEDIANGMDLHEKMYNQKSNQTPLHDSYFSQMPMGMNIGMGIASLAAPNAEQRELIKNMPEIMMGRQPTGYEKATTQMGALAPGMMTGAPGMLGRLAAQGGIGAAMNPENPWEGARSNLLGQAGMEGLGALGKGVNAIATKMMPERIKNYLMDNLSNKMSLGEHAKDFAKRIKSTYENVKSGISKEYDNFFIQDGIGNKDIYPAMDITKKVGKAGLPSKGKYYPTIPKLDIPGSSEEFDLALKAFNKKPTLRNAHELNSEMLSEQRQLEKQIKVARGRGESVIQQSDQLRQLKATQDKLEKKMQEAMGDRADEYSKISRKWKKEVIPYHADRNLRNIVNGDNTNPSKSEFSSIFKNPDEDTVQVVKHLGEKSKNDIAYQAIGKQPDTTSPNELADSIKRINNNGFEDYISKELKNYGLGLSGKSLPALGKAGVATLIGEHYLKNLLSGNKLDMTESHESSSE